MNELTIALLLALVAFLYASVGHGGASGYIAVMTLLGFAPEVVRPTALTLNLFVSAMAFAQFTRAGHFRWRLFWPFAAASMPMAWMGARIHLDVVVYKRILAVCLLIAVGRLLGFFGGGDERKAPPALAVALAIGAVLGLMAVMQNLADPSKLGKGIAAAFTATIYGIGLANLFFLPMASKLKSTIAAQTQVREMIIEGMIGIAQGENPRAIEARLQSFMHG